ncbi:MAG: ATP-binding protein [candidate division FCPU426 bacterium]
MLVLVFQVLTVIICLSIGIGVFVRAPKNPASLGFSLFAVFLGLWVVFGFLWNMQVRLGILSDLTPRLSMSMICLAANSLLVFSCYFPQPHPWINLRLVLFSFALALIVAGLSFTPASIRSTQLIDGRLVRAFGPLYLLFAGYTVGAGVTAILNLAFAYRRLRFNVERQKVRYVFFGLVLVIPTVVLFMFILPYFGVPQLFFAGQPAFLIFVGFTAYAIIRYRALDISRMALTTFMTILTGMVTVAVIFLGVRLARPWLEHTSDLGISLFGLGLFGLVMIYYRWIKPWLERRLPFGQTDVKMVMESLNREMSHLRTLEEFGEDINRHLHELYKPVRLSILALQEGGRGLRRLNGSFADTTFTPAEHQRFLQWLEKTDEVHELGQVEINPVYQEVREDAEAYFAEVGAAVIIPLVFDRRLIGVIHLGPKTSGRDYIPADLRFLATLRHDLSLALSNSRLYQKINTLYQEVKETSENLELRVALRTSELESALEQLQRIDHLKSDFIATASHELRTPTTSIKGALLMAVELHNKGEIGPRLGNYLEMCSRNIDRLVNLINDLLDLSRLESGQLKMDFQPLSVAMVFRSAIETVGPLLARKDILVQEEFSETLPFIPADRERLQQVVVNLLHNAIKFSTAGKKLWVSAWAENDRVRCQVRDEGGGIAPENKEKIFEKFWRPETFSKDREEGTGLGLAIAKIIIELHYGRIWVESEIGKGSTFIFELPKSRPSV